MSQFKMTTVVIGILGLATIAWAENDALTVTMPAAVSPEIGLAAWGRINDVFTHPRCANCHVGDDNIPLWQSTDSDIARAHGMNITAGDSRIGVEYLQCATCHVTSAAPNTVPHAPPHTGVDWQLAPVEFTWVGKTSAEICAQLRNPDTNGGRDLDGLIEHLTHDADVRGFITWGFNPGGTRQAAPYGMQAHLDDIIAWGVAGMPCPTSED